MTDVDGARLASSVRAPAHTEMAVRARRSGVWFYAETVLRGMRAFAVPILLYAVAQPLLYLLALGVGLGELVDRGSGPVEGVDYLVFVAPALLVSTVVMSVSAEMTFPVMSGFKWNRLYYGPVASPLEPSQIALGHFTAVMIRFAVQGLVFWLVMLAFGAAPTGVWPSVLLVPIGMLAAAAFGAPLQAYAATLDDGFQFSLIQRFVVMPMFLFSGTFFPLSAMPVYLHWIGWISPVWHGTQLARLVSYGADVPVPMVVLHVVVLLTCAGLGLRWAVRTYTRRLRS